MLMVMTFMTMTGTNSKSLVTANVTSFGPLSRYLGGLAPQHVVAVQEHHVPIDRLGEQQSC